jgi:hypothetical protein
MKVLSKSRFKLGLECPNKLYYTGKKEYANQKTEDSFLQALAEGGFQVEELSRMHYPGGELMEGRDGDYEHLNSWTHELLQRENVTIYEAAFLHESLFVRTDILVKTGNKIRLIEVKAKSFNSNDPNIFIGKRGGLVTGWKPYLFDLAFQAYVLQKCYPEFEVSSYFMMADKTKKATVDGLNQLFRISRNSESRTGIIKLVDSIEEIGESVLSEVNVDDVIQGIHSSSYKYHDSMGFEESIVHLKNWYIKDEYPNWPLNFSSCKSCEYKSVDDSLKSGYHECFKKQKGLDRAQLEKPNIFEVWNFRKGAKLFEDDRFFLEELNIDDIGIKEVAGKLSSSERQWIQIEKAVEVDNSIYLDKEGLKEEMDSWKWPLHFIDFETSAVALPFTAGMHPYEQVAFQFSHHVLYSDGKIEHQSEFLSNTPGEFPNVNFVRRLKAALSHDDGTIFRFATHENSILNAIYDQLTDSKEEDRLELKEFIKSITNSKNDRVEKWVGERNMVDLCQVIKDYYYNPLTKGSNSIKAVLPAVLATSTLLQNKYSQPISQINVTSHNFAPEHVWLRIENGKVISPYKMLPALFEGWTEEELDGAISEMESLSDGGAALTAYGKLQYQDMTVKERETLSQGLLKYCELDTLAMVMIYEHLKEII